MIDRSGVKNEIPTGHRSTCGAQEIGIDWPKDARKIMAPAGRRPGQVGDFAPLLLFKDHTNIYELYQIYIYIQRERL